MRKYLKLFGLALAAVTLAALPLAAQELTGTLKKIKETGSVTIGHRDASIPFSYYDDKQQPVGFALGICRHIVDAIKAELKLDKIDVKYALVTSANRIPLMANGTIDLECGSTTNNVERQKQVSFTNSHFVTASRYVTKTASKIVKIEDLKGKTVVSTSGTTNIKQLNDVNNERKLGINILPANGHAEAFYDWRFNKFHRFPSPMGSCCAATTPPSNVWSMPPPRCFTPAARSTTSTPNGSRIRFRRRVLISNCQWTRR